MSNLDAVAILTVNEFDILNSFPEEERQILDITNLSQDQLDEIALLAQEKLFKFISDEFWSEYSDSVREAAMEVLGLDFDEEFNLVKGK